jgi:peptidyl-Lys metalloendopeptidase
MRAMFLIIALLGTLAPMQASAADQPEGTPFKLTLNVKSPVRGAVLGTSAEFSVGYPVEVTIVLTNTSSHEISGAVGDQMGLASGYLYDIRDRNGDPIQRQQWKGPVTGRAKDRGPVKPGESLTQGSEITSAYDLSIPGTYTIQVSRHASDEPGAPLLKSNPVTVTILPTANSH